MRDDAVAAVGTDRTLNRVRAKENWVWAADLVPHAVRAFPRAGRSSRDTRQSIGQRIPPKRSTAERRSRYTDLDCTRDANRCRRASRRFRPARPRGRTNRQIADELSCPLAPSNTTWPRAMHTLNVDSHAAFQPGGLQG
ncbi:hypothetical protein LX88_006096 [Lentzea californiensis]|nr:hypothetical protein [Lentzea californiensis]